MIRVTVFNEFLHERNSAEVGSVYPLGIHGCIKGFLESDEIRVRTATLEDEECGLTQSALDDTDVLIWWGHIAHERVPDAVALRVQKAVLSGMGAIFLHSGHHSKPFRLLMGTSCNLSWREHGDFERLWVVNPAHPIARGIDRFILIPHEETYCEPFVVPEPEETVFIGSFERGEVFRSGLCYRRGNGRIFYFQPGHESFPIYSQSEIRRVIINAVYWAAPAYRAEIGCPNVEIP